MHSLVSQFGEQAVNRAGRDVHEYPAQLCNTMREATAIYRHLAAQKGP